MTLRFRNETTDRSSTLDETLFSVWNLENVKIVKRVIVSVVGVTVLLIGIALLVLPGPAFSYSDRTRYSCYRIRMGATLAEKSSSNCERRYFRP